MNTFFRKASAAMVSVSMALVSFAPVVTPMAHAANATPAVVVIDTINGQPLPAHCVAGAVTIVGHGTTGGSGGPYYLDIGWGDGATTTISDASPEKTSGTLTGSLNNFTFTVSHTPTGPTTGITVFLHHSQPSGNDSNFTILNQCIAPPTQGVVTVIKNVVGGTATAANFTLHVQQSATDVTGSPFAGSTSGKDFLLNPNTYTVSENAYSSYTQTSLVCTGNNATTTNGSVTVVAGKNYVCTLTNTYVPPTTGGLIVVKQVSNTHGGTLAPTNFNLHVKQGSSDVSGSPAAGSATGVSYTLAGGAYTVSEDAVAGYTPNYSSCGSAGTVTVTNGATTTCTVVNSDSAPLLTLLKSVVNAFRGTVFASAWTLSAVGPTSSISGVSPVTSGSTFNAGTYALSETGGPSNYDQSIACFNGTATTTGASLTIGVGDTVSCLFTNTEQQPGTLHVIKHVVNDNAAPFTGTASAADFTLSVSGGNPSPASFAGNETGVDVTIDAGASYSVSETAGPAGYGVSYSTDCSGTMPVSGTRTCTVTNNDVPASQGYLTLYKVVVNDNGGTATASDWTLSASSTSMTDGVAQLMTPGVYTIGESGPSGYSNTTTCSTDGGAAVTTTSVDIQAGHTYVCTLTNNDIAPTLTLQKTVSNTHGGTATASNWTLAALGATSTISGAGSASSDGTFQAGTYTLSESNGPTSYVSGSWSCTGDVTNTGSSITLGIGQHATCSITNSDAPASLRVIKTVVNDNGGTKQASDFTLHVTGTNPSLTSFTGNASGTVVSLDAGTYAVSEDAVAGYGGTMSADCSGTISAGESKTCTVTNDDGKASLTIVKHTTGADGTFSFTINGGATTSLTTNSFWATTTIALDAATYALAETASSGWTQSSAVCSNGNAPSSLTLNSGDAVTCTFTNDRQMGTLLVKKVVVNDNNGSATSSSFSMHVLLGTTDVAGSPQAGSVTGTVYTLATNSYKVTETGPSGYGASFSGDCDSSGTVTVNANATSTCVVTNDDNAPAPAPTPTPGGGGAGVIQGGPNGYGFINSSGLVLGTSTDVVTDCSKYLTAYLKSGKDNDTAQVLRLQRFLNDFEAGKVSLTGVYDSSSVAAVNAFQEKYKADILTPWGINHPTGYVYYTTQKKVNEIYCKFTKQFPLTSDQLSEIAKFKAAGEAYMNATGGTGSTAPTAPSAPSAPQVKPAPKAPDESSVGQGVDVSSQTAAAASSPEPKKGLFNRFWHWLLGR